jgi:hypothetical protein
MIEQPNVQDLVVLARAGDLQPILHLCGVDDDGEGDILAYKWLNVASDFGHAEADDLVDDLLERSSLRYDDDNLVTGGVHFELGVAYLNGGDCLPRDPKLARQHLTTAARCRYPEGLQGSDELLAHTRTVLAGESQVIFNAIYPQGGMGAGT